MREVKPYKTKQILNARGNIEVTVRIIDYKGVTSVQTGFSNSVNVKAHFKQMYNEAVLNAIYKHFWNNGGYYINSKDYSIADLVESVTILKHEVIYFSDLNYYTYKRVNRKGKYYTEIRRRGQFYSLEKYDHLDKMKLDSEYNFEDDKKVKSRKRRIRKTKPEEAGERRLTLRDE